MDEHRPKCTCFSEGEMTGDFFVDTMGNRLCQAAVGMLNSLPVCSEAQNYVVAEWMAGLAVIQACNPQIQEITDGSRKSGDFDVAVLRRGAEEILRMAKLSLEKRLKYIQDSNSQGSAH